MQAIFLGQSLSWVFFWWEIPLPSHCLFVKDRLSRVPWLGSTSAPWHKENTRKQIAGSTPSCKLSESERLTYLELYCLADKQQANEVGEEVSCSWQRSWSESNSLSLGSRPRDQHIENCAPVCTKSWSWWDYNFFKICYFVLISKNDWPVMDMIKWYLHISMAYQGFSTKSIHPASSHLVFSRFETHYIIRGGAWSHSLLTAW